MINFFPRYKFIFYICNFILIILYLFPGSLIGCFLYNDCQVQPQISPDFLISTNHLYAFLVLSIVGILTFNKSGQFFIINTYLVLLSIILEVLHYFIPERSFQISDLFGNIIGVIIVIIIFYFFKKNENSKN